MNIIEYKASYILRCNSNGWYIPRKLIKQIYQGEDPEYFRIYTHKNIAGREEYIFIVGKEPSELSSNMEIEFYNKVLEYDIPIGKFQKTRIETHIRKSTMISLFPEVLISDKIKATPAGTVAILEQVI